MICFLELLLSKVRRVQMHIETLDKLKAAQESVEKQQVERRQRETAEQIPKRPQQQQSFVVTTKWETFD